MTTQASARETPHKPEGPATMREVGGVAAPSKNPWTEAAFLRPLQGKQVQVTLQGYKVDRAWADVPDWVKTESLEAPLRGEPLSRGEQAGDIACATCFGSGLVHKHPDYWLPSAWVPCLICNGTGCDPASDRFKGGIIDPRDR